MCKFPGFNQSPFSILQKSVQACIVVWSEFVIITPQVNTNDISLQFKHNCVFAPVFFWSVLSKGNGTYIFIVSTFLEVKQTKPEFERGDCGISI